MSTYPSDQQLRSQATRVEEMWGSAPGWSVVLAFAVAIGLVSWAGAAVSIYLDRGFVGLTAGAIGYTIGWVVWLTTGFLLAPRRRERGVWLGFVAGACLAVASGGGAWWFASLLAGPLIVGVWLVVMGAAVGAVSLLLVPRSLTDRRLLFRRR